MRSKLRAWTAVLAVLTVAILAFGPAAASAAGKHHRALRLTGTQIDSTFLDLGDSDLSLGDELVFSETLTRRGRDVGEDGGTCTVTDITGYDSFMANCVVTFALRRGQITAQGLIAFEEETIPDATLAITGGTGAYRGASGEVDYHQVSGAVSKYTLHLDARKTRKH
jgi:hypothetical protein